MPEVKRIIDANANRAREALRVMEEAARFVLDDEALTEALKQMRHDLAGALASLAGVTAARDTPGDVGTHVRTDSEAARASVAQVAAAAGKRLSEALRAMEEYGKTLDASFAAHIEQLRYRGYDVEQRLSIALGSGTRRQWRLCVLLTESLCAHHDWQTIARAAIDGGADCIQLREKALDGGALMARTQTLVRMARPHGVSIVLNDRPDIALAGGADGVHLGQTDMPARAARRLVGGQLLIGVSTHELAHARQALQDGADYVGVGPMFVSDTKQKDHIAGPDYLRAYLQWDKLPHLAIGGISPDNLDALIDVGVRGIAVSGCICASHEPRRVTEELRRRLEDAATTAVS